MFLFLTPQNNSLLSAFHPVCAFMGLVSKVYFVKFYVHSSCVHVLNVLLHNNLSCVFMENYTFQLLNFFRKVCQVASKQDTFLN